MSALSNSALFWLDVLENVLDEAAYQRGKLDLAQEEDEEGD